MTARYYTGDTRDVLATLEPASVDLVLSSPPFFALRSYLPGDDPAKASEIGAELTPGAFIDTLLGATYDVARALAGWTDCGHDTCRRGVVLDPFAGTGTTLAVAEGHGRDSVGIDLDRRNADLARERVGMFLEIAEPVA